MNRVYLLYGLSGLVSLGYQVAWFRIYVDWFGSTNLTFAMVLCNFIGGLGVGALASRPVADRLGAVLGVRDRLRLYGVVELLVAASVGLLALARLVPATAWGDFPYELQGSIYAPGLLPQLSKLALAALCVFVPCFFMGVTFPLLCQVYGARSRFPSLLYGWNTLGACSGVLLCEFVLLPRVGHDLTLWIMMGTNGLLGLFFLAMGGAPAAALDAAGPGALPDRTESPPAAPRDAPRDAPGPQRFGVLLACAILSGLLAGGLEADMFKRVGFLSNKSPAAMSFISFWAILAIFVASWTVRALSALKLKHIKVAFVLALVVYFTTWELGQPIRSWLVTRAYAPLLAGLPEPSYGPITVAGRFPTSLGQVLVFAGIFVFPAYVLISLLLPYVCNRLQSGRRHLGIAYGANTLAFCAGMVAFTWLAPRVSIFYSMKLMMVTLAIGAGLLLLVREQQRLAAWKPALAVAALAIAALLTPAGFDRSYVSPGMDNARYPVRAMKSNGASTTYVVASPDGDRLYFDNHSMSGTNHAAQVYMRLMAHFPLLAHARPERALLICFGVGNTADAIANHATIQALDVVDLNDKVIETAPEFARTNHRVYADPRVRFIHDDGRNFLNTTTITYDLITSEPPPPLYAGVYRLYSREYYEQVLAHLSSTGLMSQWLPVHEMPQEAVDLAVATFVDTFPHALLFVGIDMEYILVGSASPIDLERIEQRFGEQPKVVQDLGRLGIHEPLELLARVAKGDALLSREYGSRPTISDQNNDLTYVFASPLAPGVIRYDPRDRLTEIGTASEPLRRALMHLGRLRYLAEFPYETLATVPADAAPQVVLADLDWKAIAAIQARCRPLEQAAAAGDAQADVRRIELLNEALALGAEQPELLMDLAGAHSAIGDADGALAALQRFQAIEPDDPAGYYRQGLTLLGTQRMGEALPALQRAAELAPNDAEMHFTLGLALASVGDLESAQTHYRRSVDLDPEHLQARLNLGIALVQAGRVDEAVEQWRQAGEMAPEDPQAHLNMGLARQGQGNLDQALRHFRDAVRIQPDYAQAHKSLGLALMQKQKFKPAVTHLRTALELDPGDAQTRQHLAQAEAMLASG